MKKHLFVSVILLIFSFIPFLILDEQSWIQIHDNLDSEFIYLHLLKESNNLFSLDGSGTVPQIFNGLSVNYFHSEFSFIRVLFYMFPSFWAYVINSFLVRLVGVFGMHLLISTYFRGIRMPQILRILIPLSFGLLPVYSLYGLSVMGQPLLLWSFLNLKSCTKVFTSLIIIILFPFYSHFAMTAPFLLIVLFLCGVWLILTKVKISAYYYLGIGVLFFSYILANYLTIENFIFSDIVSHRADWHGNVSGFGEIINEIFNTLFYGQYHSSFIFGLPVFILGMYIVLRRLDHWKSIGLIMLSIMVISLFHGIYRNFSVPLEEYLHIFTSFQFNRFTVLIPFLYYLILIKLFSLFSEVKYLLIIISVIFMSINLYSNNEIKYNVVQIILPEYYKNSIVSFSEFYAEDIFQRIGKHIDFPQEEYRVVSLGLHPSVAQYNGFYTLDSYQNNYPLNYKNKFREVIEGELNKDKELKDYYDNWGNRCYLFSAELRETCGSTCTKASVVSVNELSINTNVLKQLGCRYIISTVRILNTEALNLKFEKLFESNRSPIEIYLYRL